MFLQAVEILRGWDRAGLTALVQALRDRGYADVSDAPGLTPGLIMAWDAACDEVLATHGYLGSPVRAARRTTPDGESTPMLYDPARVYPEAGPLPPRPATPTGGDR